MRAEDLELNELLELDPAGGLVRFAGERAVVFNALAQGILRKEMIDAFGVTAAQGILSRFGYVHGRRLAESMRSQFSWDTQEDWRKAGPRIYSLQGLFLLEPDSLSSLASEGGTWRVSYEAEQHIIHLGRVEYPVCWTLCGLISGYLSFAMGKDVYALEDRCMGKGDAACHIRIKSADQWGDESADHVLSFNRVEMDDALTEVSEKIKIAERRLRERKRKLAQVAGLPEDPSNIVARSRQMRQVLELTRRIAIVDSTVLITGESGTGKELLAQYIHEHSSHADGPFIGVNCGAISESLLESEFFGHARGAFTGASGDRPGLFEAANGGTLFLDEVGEIPLAMQVKLLRALQEREVRRVGENKNRPISVRVIAATNRDLLADVKAKMFREDLYYRLKVIEVAIPPLRFRKEDILPLARLLLAEAAIRMKRSVTGLSAKVADHLHSYPWPGNVRELANVMERAVAVAAGKRIESVDLPPEVRVTTPLSQVAGGNRTLQDIERECILATLHANDGNRMQTAKTLGIGVATLYRKLGRYKDLPEVGKRPSVR